MVTSKGIASMDRIAGLSMKDRQAPIREKKDTKQIPCREFMETGTCTYGDKLKFPHQLAGKKTSEARDRRKRQREAQKANKKTRGSTGSRTKMVA